VDLGNGTPNPAHAANVLNLVVLHDDADYELAVASFPTSERDAS
jgi:hypothetical protein